jgi:hypothetical protein
MFLRSAVFIGAFLQGQNLLYSYDIIRPTHQWLAHQAYHILPDSEMKKEIGNYLVSNPAHLGLIMPNDDNYGCTPWVYDGGYITEGACEEDEGYYLTDYKRFSDHFWNPDGGYDDGWAGKKSAIDRAQQHWNSAIDEYKMGHYGMAYWYLGRIAHLLGDMAQPAHVHKDTHGCIEAASLFCNDNFENFVGQNFYAWNVLARRTGSATTPQNLDKLNQYPLEPVNYGSLPILNSKALDPTHGIGYNYTDLPSSRKTPLFRLFLNLAETSDAFESEGENSLNGNAECDNMERNKDPWFLITWHSCSTFAPNAPFSNAEAYLHADTLLPLAIRYIAGLYELFWETTHSCHFINSGADLVEPWGMPYNVFSAEHELLLKVLCPNELTTSTMFQVVNSGTPAEQFQLTWAGDGNIPAGYRWTAGGWVAITFSGGTPFKVEGKEYPEWRLGTISTAIPSSGMQSEYNYVVAYVCTWTGTQWKCGCHDSNCAPNFWQLQAWKQVNR